MQVWSEGHVLEVIRDRLCVKDLWNDEGSQWAIHEHAHMIYLAGSRNRKTRRTARVLEEDKGSSHANQG